MSGTSLLPNLSWIQISQGWHTSVFFSHPTDAATPQLVLVVAAVLHLAMPICHFHWRSLPLAPIFYSVNDADFRMSDTRLLLKLSWIQISQGWRTSLSAIQPHMDWHQEFISALPLVVES